MKRIDCISFSSSGSISKNSALEIFLKGLHQGLLAAGLESRYIQSDWHFPGEMINELIVDRPECILMFNGIPVNDQNESVSGDLKIPNISILVDAPFYFFNEMKLPYIIFTCVDRSAAEFYRKIGFQRMLFFPHGIQMQDRVDTNKERTYQAVMFADFLDPEKIRFRWKEKYSPDLCRLMDGVAKAVLNGHVGLTPLAFIELLDRSKQLINLGGVTLKLIFHEIETYVKGKDRLELLRSIKGSRVDLFCLNESAGWNELIKQDNIVLHDPVSYDEGVAIMRESRVVLSSNPTIRDGTHEAVFAGLMGGASILCSKSRYLEEQFPEGNGLRFYAPGDYASVDAMIAEILADENRRLQEALAGRAIVEMNHTWDARARQIKEEAGPIVDAINRGGIVP